MTRPAVAAAILGLVLLAACDGGSDEATPPSVSATSSPTAEATDGPTPTGTATPSSLPTAGRSCTVLEEPLRLFPGHDLSMANRGSYVLEVREMQSMVNGAGDGSDCIPEDGDFGPVTKEAVIAFQTRYGLVVDGLVGEETWNQLNLILSH